MYTYIFMYHTLDTKTLERNGVNSIKIFARHCFDAIEQFKKKHHPDFIISMRNIELNTIVSVQICSDKSVIFKELK